jgi:hypothetical protein
MDRVLVPVMPAASAYHIHAIASDMLIVDATGLPVKLPIHSKSTICEAFARVASAGCRTHASASR